MIKQIKTPWLGSNAYLIITDDLSFLVDSGIDNTVFEFLRKKGVNIEFIVNTHAHADHCAGNRFFKNKVAYLHAYDLEVARSCNFYSTRAMLGIERFSYDYEEVDKKIKAGEYVFKVLHTPGHTRGSICLYEPNKKILISGDTVFGEGSFGRVDLGGDASMQISSLEFLSKLDVEVLMPGHGDIVKLGGKDQIKSALENAKAFFRLEQNK